MNTDQNIPRFTPRFATRMGGMQASEIRELLKLIDQPGVTSFAGGIPDPVLFPHDAVRAAYAAVLADDTRSGAALQYSVSEGDPALRDWIVAHMTAKGVPCRRENILITNGSQQGLEFLGKLFLSPGDTAVVAAPTYLGALQAFSPNQPVYDTLRLSPANRTAQSYVDAAAATGGALGFAYVVPDFANPTGETMTEDDRLRLLTMAAEADMPVIEDSPYATLRYDGAPVAPLQALDIRACGSIDASRVIHCGSFSKIFMPGLRVGWVCASEDIIHRLTLIKQASDLNCPRVNQLVMLHLASTIYDEQVARTCTHYRRKRDAMLAALDRHMTGLAEWSRPDGGMFIWVTLPEGTDTAALLPDAVAEAGAAYVPGHAFFADKSGRNTLRLSFTLPAEAAIEPAIGRLATFLKGRLSSRP